MAKSTVYPYGTNGQLPSSIGLVNDLTTGGVNKALTAEQGKVLGEKFMEVIFENSSNADWKTGNVSNGVITTSYANKYLIIPLPTSATNVVVKRATATPSFNITLYRSSDGKNFNWVGEFDGENGTRSFSRGESTYLLVLLWDKPTTEQARTETFEVIVDGVEFITKNEADNNIFETDKLVASSLLFHKLANDLWIKEITAGTDEFSWEQGGINGVTGALENNSGAIRTNAIDISDGANLYISSNRVSGFYFFVTFYDAKMAKTGARWDTSVTVTDYTEYIPEGSRYFRMCYYSGKPISPNNASANAMVIKMTLNRSMLAAQTEKTFSNPLINIDLADPCIVKGDDEFFYMLGTGDLSTKKMYRSTNLVDWEVADRPFTDNAVADCYADLGVSSVNFWAPEIVKIGDKYNLYTSRAANPMLAFQSKHPNFGYEYKGKIITNANGLQNDNIDACVRYDIDGTLWMFWGSTYGMYRQRLTQDGLSLDTNYEREHVAGLLVSQDRTRAKVFEGAYLYRKKGYWYLFVSAGIYSNYTYCLKVGRCQTLAGNFVDKDGNNMTDGYATTILSSASGDTLYGPGHNGQIITDRNNRTYILYHSHDTRAGASSSRYVCMQEMFWDEDGWPYFIDGKPQIVKNIIPEL